jgi:hypothetical protein
VIKKPTTLVIVITVHITDILVFKCMFKNTKRKQLDVKFMKQIHIAILQFERKMTLIVLIMNELGLFNFKINIKMTNLHSILRNKYIYKR